MKAMRMRRDEEQEPSTDQAEMLAESPGCNTGASGAGRFSGRSDSNSVKVQDVESDDEWDDLVRRAIGGTVFHSSAWTSSLRRPIVRLGAYKAGTLEAGILAFDDRTDQRLDTITPYQGPLVAPRETKALKPADSYRLLLPLARSIRERVREVRFYTSPWLESLHPFLEEGYEARLLYTYLLSKRRAEDAWNSFSPGLRSNIRSAVRAGLSVEQTDSTSDLLRLAAQSLERQEQEIWFDVEEATACLKTLAEKGQAGAFVTRNSDGDPVAAVAIVRDTRRSYYVLGGYDHTSKHRGGSSLAMWAAIQFAYSEWGLSEFDFEGSYLPFVARFFRQFADELRPFFFVTLSDRPLY